MPLVISEHCSPITRYPGHKIESSRLDPRYWLPASSSRLHNPNTRFHSGIYVPSPVPLVLADSRKGQVLRLTGIFIYDNSLREISWSSKIHHCFHIRVDEAFSSAFPRSNLNSVRV